jgi:hypothetical protein
MATDYVLFIHGVNTREDGYANNLINLIKHNTPIQPLVVFWGKEADEKEEELLHGYQASGIWDKLWFRNLREQPLLHFAGDIALYTSRYVGAKVAADVAEKIALLKDCTAQDRLHLVTHSLGTVILFDLMFSSRWDVEGTRGHENVMAIRNAIYGLDPHPGQGIQLGSITTMGSPIGVFSLMDVDQPTVDEQSNPSMAKSTHDITPSLVKLLETLHQKLGGNKLPWLNFVHPGDPIASPLEGILPQMVDGEKTYLDIQDRLVPANIAEVFKEPIPEALLELIAQPFRQTVIAILGSGKAHLSYWQNARVAEGITESIRMARAIKSA